MNVNPLSMRGSGILLHPTSLPGAHGIGDLGTAARRFADFLAAARQSYWQVLPLGPPGAGNSPYQCLSSMAGNPLLVDLEALVGEGWVAEGDLAEAPGFPDDQVDYARVIPFKMALLKKAARTFSKTASAQQRAELEDFCSTQRDWLEPFARFVALKEAHSGAAWPEWERRRRPDPEAVQAHRFAQFLFFRQWRALRRACNDGGIALIGDIPIFVAYDSADVWQHPELFDLDAQGRPRVIAGVPPDYFSATGQLWGNPLYRWDVMAETGYRWWIERVRTTLEMVDVVRIDHFRGFESCYAVAAGATTAAEGAWVEGPGAKLFEALRQALGPVPVIAEDLGLITPEVDALRDRFGFPGMRILQFAFDSSDPDHPFQPHNFIRNCVVYTGTHDNDTVVGWFARSGSDTRSAEQARAERELTLRYLNSDGREIHWDFIRAALASVANTAIVPLQDVLGLGSEARMNRPAAAENQWKWRFRQRDLKPELAARLRQMTELYGRCRPASEREL